MSNIVVLYEMNKKYFRDLVDTLGAKLKELPVNSYIRSHFPASRLEQMSRKIEESHCKDLEWDYWQPFFLFLKNADVAVIQALESELQMVMARTSSRWVAKLVAFLNDEQVRGSSCLAACRINYNAEKRISHIEMELIEKLLAQQAVYCC